MYEPDSAKDDLLATIRRVQVTRPNLVIYSRLIKGIAEVAWWVFSIFYIYRSLVLVGSSPLMVHDFRPAVSRGGSAQGTSSSSVCAHWWWKLASGTLFPAALLWARQMVMSLRSATKKKMVVVCAVSNHGIYHLLWISNNCLFFCF